MKSALCEVYAKIMDLSDSAKGTGAVKGKCERSGLSPTHALFYNLGPYTKIWSGRNVCSNARICKNFLKSALCEVYAKIMDLSDSAKGTGAVKGKMGIITFLHI